jgi:hypothetical protein
MRNGEKERRVHKEWNEGTRRGNDKDNERNSSRLNLLWIFKNYLLFTEDRGRLAQLNFGNRFTVGLMQCWQQCLTVSFQCILSVLKIVYEQVTHTNKHYPREQDNIWNQKIKNCVSSKVVWRNRASYLFLESFFTKSPFIFDLKVIKYLRLDVP